MRVCIEFELDDHAIASFGASTPQGTLRNALLRLIHSDEGREMFDISQWVDQHVLRIGPPVLLVRSNLCGRKTNWVGLPCIKLRGHTDPGHRAFTSTKEDA